MTREDAKNYVCVGWYKLIDLVYDSIPDIDIVDISDNFGTLSISIGEQLSEKESDVMFHIEELSEYICQYCGKVGEPRDYPEMVTLCDKCNEEHKL